MKRVYLIKNNIKTMYAHFESENELNDWLNDQISRNIFGLPGRPETIENENGELVETGVILPAEYQIEIEDITAQIEQEKINAEALAFLASTDFKVLRHIRQKALGQTLSLSEQEYLALEQERSDAAARIVR